MAITTPTHYYKFDSDANDSVGAINGSVTGATNAAGKINNGYTFVSASSQYIAFGTTAWGTGDAYTIAFWFKSSTAATQHLVSRENAGSGGEFHIRLESDGHLDWQNYSSAGATVLSIHVATNYGDGNWHHVACVQNGSTAVMYVDGVSAGTDASSNTTAWTGSIQTYVGRIATNTSNMLNGQLDELGVWNVGLTAVEVSQLYSAGIGLQYDFSKQKEAWSGTGASMPSGYTGYEYTSQTFTASSTYNLDSVQLYVKKIGSPTGNMTCYLYAADANDKPTGSVLATSGTYSVSSLTTSYNWVNVFTFTSPYAVQSGTSYALVFAYDGDNSNYLNYECSSNAADDVKYGSAVNSLNDYYNGYTATMRIFGSAAPSGYSKKINGITTYSKINGVAVAGISKFNGV